MRALSAPASRERNESPSPDAERTLIRPWTVSVVLAATATSPFLASIRAELRNLGLNGVVRRSLDGSLYVTDNGNWILDAHGLVMASPEALEKQLNQIPGVVTVGLFAIRKADLLLVAGDNGVKRYE